MATVFFTGFPGFLGTELLPRVLARAEDDIAVCLVQPQFMDLAEARVEELVAADPSLDKRIRMVPGDITKPDLGLGEERGLLAGDVREIFHLAAVYDLTVSRDVGMRVNVDGTRHLCDFAEDCEGLDRFQYVSTCYVSGRWPGIFAEEDLEKPGQVFNNFYEETKHLAEVVVRERMEAGLPATIYRPSVVSGDSTTGATQKFDGPYFVLRWLLKQPRVAVMPVVGDPASFTFNFVPRDFVVDAIDVLSGRDRSKGQTYALADPEPMPIGRLLDAMAEATGRRLVRLPLPRRFAKPLLAHVPLVERLLEIPPPAVDYFTHPTHYLTSNASADLDGTGVTLPDKQSWLRALANFVRDNPNISSSAMA